MKSVLFLAVVALTSVDAVAKYDAQTHWGFQYGQNRSIGGEPWSRPWRAGAGFAELETTYAEVEMDEEQDSVSDEILMSFTFNGGGVLHPTSNVTQIAVEGDLHFDEDEVSEMQVLVEVEHYENSQWVTGSGSELHTLTFSGETFTSVMTPVQWGVGPLTGEDFTGAGTFRMIVTVINHTDEAGGDIDTLLSNCALTVFTDYEGE